MVSSSKTKTNITRMNSTKLVLWKQQQASWLLLFLKIRDPTEKKPSKHCENWQ